VSKSNTFLTATFFREGETLWVAIQKILKTNSQSRNSAISSIRKKAVDVKRKVECFISFKMKDIEYPSIDVGRYEASWEQRSSRKEARPEHENEG